MKIKGVDDGWMELELGRRSVEKVVGSEVKLGVVGGRFVVMLNE